MTTDNGQWAMIAGWLCSSALCYVAGYLSALRWVRKEIAKIETEEEP